MAYFTRVLFHFTLPHIFMPFFTPLTEWHIKGDSGRHRDSGKIPHSITSSEQNSMWRKVPHDVRTLGKSLVLQWKSSCSHRQNDKNIKISNCMEQHPNYIPSMDLMQQTNESRVHVFFDRVTIFSTCPMQRSAAPAVLPDAFRTNMQRERLSPLHFPQAYLQGSI